MFVCSTGYTRIHTSCGQHVSNVSELKVEGMDDFKYFTPLLEKTEIAREFDVTVTLRPLEFCQTVFRTVTVNKSLLQHLLPVRIGCSIHGFS